LDTVGGIIYSCIPWNKKNGGQKTQSRQSLASEKQHQDTKGSRIGSKTNRPTMIRTKPDFFTPKSSCYTGYFFIERLL
jgi:hypothetical protein